MVSGCGDRIYGASKHAALNLTESLHLELQAAGAEHLTVHALLPAVVATALTANARAASEQASDDRASAKDLAGAMAFEQLMADGATTPAMVAEQAFDAMAAGRFYIPVDHPTNETMRFGIETAAESRVRRVLAGEPPVLAGDSAPILELLEARTQVGAPRL